LHTTSPARGPAALLAALLASLAIGTGEALAQADPWTGNAVIVGISDYKGWTNDLLFCDNDAEDLRDALFRDSEHWNSGSYLSVLIDADATVGGISSAIAGMELATAGTSDVCVFFFSGHGGTQDDADGDGDETTPGDDLDETLVAHDGDVLDDDLSSWLSAFTTQRVCVIIDTCYAGGMAKSPGGTTAAGWISGMVDDIAGARPAKTARSSARGTKDLNDPVLGSVDLVALMACEDLQTSEEDYILRNGVFTFYVVDAMNRLATDANADGLASAEEIFAYAAPRASAWNPTQTPFLLDGNLDELHQLPVVNAGEGDVEHIVTVEDLPFGGGIVRGGCAASRPGPGRRVALALLAALGAVACAPRRHTGRVDHVVRTTRLGRVDHVVRTTRRRRRAAALALFLLACTGLGCFHVPASRTDRRARSSVEYVAAEMSPLGTGRIEAADAPDAAAPSYLPGPAGAGTDGRLVMGVRAGALVPLASRNASYAETVQAGFFAAARLMDVPFEIGVDACRLESRDLDVAAYVLSGRLDVLAVRGPTRWDRESYFHFGPRLLVDFVDTYWAAGSELAVAVGAGVGVRAPGGVGWDARLSIDGLLGSANITGFLSLSGGFRF
jgi:hypothetical protein